MTEATRPTRDRGFTLTELIISVTITGVMLSSISFALLFMLSGSQRAESSVSQARDVSFIQTWVPIDLASAIEIDSDPAVDPSGGALPGTNLMTIERANLVDVAQPNYFVSYRYVDGPDGWEVIRYEVRNPGTASQDIFRVRIAREVMPPPTGWDPAAFPDHAVDVTTRNPSALRAAGLDFTITFVGGSTFTIGGAGPGEPDSLPTDGLGGFVDPAAPPSRCGGDIVLVLDESGSIGSNMFQVEDAAKGIVENFQGTPTTVRVIGFDFNVEAIAPSTWNGAPVDLLTMTEGEKNTLNNLIDSQLNAGGGTNWEGGLRMGMSDFTVFNKVDPSPNPATLLIFVTDGDPTVYVNNAGNSVGASSYDQALAEAKGVSDERGALGIEFKGIYIKPGGAASVSADSQQRLKDIVGATEWVNTPSDPIGNADVASFFIGDPSELAGIFQQLFASDCGGTVTVQKRVVNGGTESPPGSGTWTFTSTAGVLELDAATNPAITFDYTVIGEVWEPIVEDPVPGRTLSDVRCSVRGVDVTADRVRALNDTDGSPIPNGREIRVVANEALSCVWVST